MDVQRVLIVFGLIALLLGLAWPIVTRLGLGRLPGDLVIERDNFTFYAPIVTCLLLSVIVSIAIWMFNR
jgi:hypothetical protein